MTQVWGATNDSIHVNEALAISCLGRSRIAAAKIKKRTML